MIKLAIKILINSEEVLHTATESVSAPMIIQFLDSVNEKNITLLKKYIDEVHTLKGEGVANNLTMKDDVVLTENIYGDIQIEKDMLMLIPFCAQSSVIRYTSFIKETKNIITIIDHLRRWNEEASKSFLFMSNFFTNESKPILYELTNAFKRQEIKLLEASKVLNKAIKGQ